MSPLNDPRVVAEVTAACEAYERALVANDVAALQASFWDSPYAVRFGATEQSYGAEEIRAFRQKRVMDFADRRTLRLTVLALGPDAAVATTEFSAWFGSAPRHGRQMQVWIRLPVVGWKIATAHISHLPVPDDEWCRYAQTTAAAVGLPLDPDHRPGVVRNLETMAALNASLLAFSLPPGTEPASVFVP